MGSPFALFEGKPRAHYLFNEPFEERGHRAMPQRVNDEKMLCGNDHVTRRRQHFRNGLSLKFLLRTQQWEVEFRGLDASNLMPTENRAFGICIGESVAEPISSGIGVALNNREASWHGRLTYGLAELTCINGYDARSGQDDIASLVRKGVMDEDTKRKVVELLDQHRIMTVATNRPDGWPQATTVGYANDGLILYFLCSPNSQKAENLAKDNRLSLTVDHDTADPMAITGLSMAAFAYPANDPKEAAKAIELLGARYPEYAAFPKPKPEENSHLSSGTKNHFHPGLF